jgi:hypothetical protein
MAQQRLSLVRQRRLQYYQSSTGGERSMVAIDSDQETAARNARMRDAVDFIAARVGRCGRRNNPGLNIQSYELMNAYQSFAKLVWPGEIPYPGFENALMEAVAAIPQRVVFHYSESGPMLYLPDELPRGLSNGHKPSVDKQVAQLNEYLASLNSDEETGKPTTK